MLNIIQVLFSSGSQQFKTSIGRPMFRFCVIAQPIIFGLLLGMIYLKKTPQDFMLYAMLGSGLSTFWSSICFSSASDIMRERWYGTLENLFAAPVGFKWIVLGKILGNSLWGLISFLISVSVVVIFFDKPIMIQEPLWLLVGFIFMTLSLIAIAYLFAGLFTLSRNARTLMNFFEAPIFILCGMMFPLEMLPKFILPLSYLFSPTWAVKILRFSVIGGETSEVLPFVIGIVILTALYSLMSILLFNQIDKKCRIDATLEVY